MGHEDVLGLQVPVDNLFAVYVCQCFSKFGEKFLCQFASQHPPFHHFTQSDAVHILHQDAVALSFDHLPSQCTADVRVVQPIADGEFLLQELLVQRIVATIFF